MIGCFFVPHVGKEKISEKKMGMSVRRVMRDCFLKHRNISKALRKTIRSKRMTGDLSRFVKGAKSLSTTEFANAVIAGELGSDCVGAEL